MKYKLYNEKETRLMEEVLESGELIQYALQNRGIDDVEHYMIASNEKVEWFSSEWAELDNINKAVSCFKSHIEKRSPIAIIVDDDVDGYTSASIMYRDIRRRTDDNYPLTYLIHEKAKAHGLSDDIKIPKDTKLLIIPDASTNDTEQCKILKEKGIDIIILDHHQLDEGTPKNEYAIIVNNQLSDSYKNKDFCGVGVVYRFIQALDDYYWTENADDYLDMVALGNISDVMDIRSMETRQYIYRGLSNINSEILKSLIKAQEYSMNGKVNIHTMQFYITPILNGMIRVGSFEEKDLLFRAFIDKYEEFEYKKRATKDKPSEIVIENIYDRAARLCKNAKARQDKKKDKSFKEVCKYIDNLPFDDKVIVADVTELLDKSLTGVVAIKVAEKYNKPVILLKKFYDKNLDKEILSGSARNINYSPIDSLRCVINDTNKFLFARGHDNAFGVAINEDDLSKAINILNHNLKDIEYDSTYHVDFIINQDMLDVNIINELSSFEEYIGQKVDDLFIAVENITLHKNEFKIIGSKEDTITFMVNGVEFIKFKCKEDDPLNNFLNNAWGDDDMVTFTIVGEPCLTDYNGLIKPQIRIKDINILESSISTMNNNEWDTWGDEEVW